MHKIDLFCNFVRLIQFGSICQIFTEHVLYQDAVSHPPAVRPGFMCPLPSVRVLTFPKAKVSIQITEVTAHRVMRPAATGHRGLRVSQHACAVAGVATWGGRELRPRGGC